MGRSAQEAADVSVEIVLDADLEAVRKQEVFRLAAVRAAIDPERRLARSDILVSAVVEALVSGPLTERELLAVVNRSWATGAVTESMLDRALQIAHHSFLVLPQTTLTGQDTWTLTDGAKEDAERDGQWAETVLLEFEVALGDRLQDYTGVTETPQSLSRIARLVFSGLGEAVEGTYGTAANSAAPGQLRPLEIDGRAVIAHLRREGLRRHLCATAWGSLCGH